MRAHAGLNYIAVVTAGILAAGIVAPGSSAYAASNAGTAVSVTTISTVSGKRGKKVLAKGMEVVRGDTVITNRSGVAQFEFEDGTRIVVGPNSKLLIEQYLMGTDSKAKKFSVNAISGTFRFLSGRSPKNVYAIKTPTATLGIRGTKFDLTVRRDGHTDILLYEGAARLCGKDRRCVELEDSCEMGTTNRNRPTRIVDDLADQADTIRKQFPYARRQRALMRAFRVDARSCTRSRRAAIRDEKARARTIANLPQQPTPAAPGPGPGPGEPPTEPPSSDIGNPGNGGSQGNAGPDPGGSKGEPGVGNSDNNGSNNGNNGNGNGNGNGKNKG